MTIVIDHAIAKPASRSHVVAQAVLKWMNPFSEEACKRRRIRREHEDLISMSNHDLRDLGLVRSDVAFGISSGRGVFREKDR
ncbi:DUF1127 domain-containing protein [Hoeflea prorocentri]|uniref:DUF1127 domain-containing protein n=1 Tax=Hoeflea prorocentri TaxID=1922333 RepID=A0A9X3UH08_9HYPH|nr:DUF1127 domain-containing protein [Hoeflea prorocentri]MCY6380695.1 DUF1127 domain-containing protein [Hoeflea prorocentri]MDA5398495.1 DUF1127 domain-containing protein [Hoeflea prorocentri]